MDDKAERRKFLGSLIIPLLIVALMWLVKIIEVSLGVNLGRWGITPHTTHGLLGILTLPFLHGSWEHLLSNTVPILVLGTALYYCYPTLANRVLLITWLGSGLLTWCIGNPDSVHIGASALVYGLNLFLIFSRLALFFFLSVFRNILYLPDFFCQIQTTSNSRTSPAVIASRVCRHATSGSAGRVALVATCVGAALVVTSGRGALVATCLPAPP